jgi:hypothetical protein
MRMKMTNKGKIHWNWVIVSLFIFNLIVMGKVFFVDIRSEGAECTLSPLQYGFNRLQSSNQYPIDCSCRLISPNPSSTLKFNETDTWEIPPDYRPDEVEVPFLDLDKINLTG